MKSLILLFSTIVLLSSCSGGNEKKARENTVPEIKVPTVAPEVADLSNHPGFKVYDQHCLPCHQEDGNGVPGMFPPLVNTKWVNGDKNTLISIVLNGMDEEIEVNGEIFNTSMAPLPYLKDQEVADVLNYVRKKFGSDPSEISPEEVKMVRSKG